MISVVIPVKNGGTDLVRCLEAIARQIVDHPVEVVVVDSGSEDGSPDRARALGARVLEIPPEDFSHGGARMLGARQARGDVLVFTSQDAYADDENWLSRLVAPLTGEKVAGIYGRHSRTSMPTRQSGTFSTSSTGLSRGHSDSSTRHG